MDGDLGIVMGRSTSLALSALLYNAAEMNTANFGNCCEAVTSTDLQIGPTANCC